MSWGFLEALLSLLVKVDAETTKQIRDSVCVDGKRRR